MNIDDLDPELLSLVDERRSSDELIWDSTVHNETVSVLLIKEQKIPQAEFMQSLGLAGGEGRLLTFESANDNYRFLGESKWIA